MIEYLDTVGAVAVLAVVLYRNQVRIFKRLDDLDRRLSRIEGYLQRNR